MRQAILFYSSVISSEYTAKIIIQQTGFAGIINNEIAVFIFEWRDSIGTIKFAINIFIKSTKIAIFD